MSFQSESKKRLIFHDHRAWQISVYLYGNMLFIRQEYQLIFTWWRHQMENFPCYWPFVRGIHRSPVNSPQKGQWCRALMYFLICVWINGWVNNHEAGNLRRYHAHCDIIVMTFWPHMVSDILVNINSGNERIYLLSSIKSYIKHLNLVSNSNVSLYTDACSMFFAVCCCLSITTEDTHSSKCIKKCWSYCFWPKIVKYGCDIFSIKKSYKIRWSTDDFHTFISGMYHPIIWIWSSCM